MVDGHRTRRALPLDRCPDPIVILDPHSHQVLDWNSQAEATFGRPEPETRCHELIHGCSAPCAGPRCPCPLAPLLETGESQTVEHVVEDEMGQRRHVMVRAVPLADADGVPREIMEIHTDITAQKADLHRLASTFEHSSQAMLITDPEGRIERVNPAFTRITGFTEAEAVGRKPGFRASGRHSIEFYKQLWRDLRTQGYWEGEIWNRRKDGVIYPEWEAISCIRNEAGAVEHYVAVFHDLSEQKARERELGQYRAVFEAARDAVMLHDGEGRFFDCNPATVTLFGASSKKDMLGLHPADLSPKGQPGGRPSTEAAEERMQQAFREGSVTFDWVSRTCQGRDFPTRVTLSRVDLADGPVLQAVVRDMSEYRAEEAKRRALIEILEATPDFVATARPDGTMLYLNRSARQLTGLPPAEDPLGRDIPPEVQGLAGQWGHPEWAARKVLEEGFPAAMRDGFWQAETALCKADGEEIPVSQIIVAHQGPDGQPERLSTIMRDISDQKQWTRELQQAAGVFENSQEGIIITDADTRILQVNDAFTRITGFHPEDVIGATPRIFQSGHHDAAFYDALWQAVNDTGSWSGEIWDKRKDGSVHAKWLTISAIRDETGRIANYVGVFSDITDLKRYQAELEHQAYHDPLTDLPNRLLFRDRLTHALDRAERFGHRVAILFMDLDHFKDVNDSMGHSAGDELLKRVAHRLREGVRDSDTVARIGGDEFNICLEQVEGAPEALSMARRIADLLAAPHRIGGRVLQTPCSIGIALYPDDGTSVETLLRNADSALYHAKDAGRDAIRFYTAELTERAEHRLGLVQDLRHAAHRGELSLLFQPQVELRSGRLAGFEALVRWHHPVKGTLRPDQFIPLAEETGMIHELGEWVLAEACRTARDWLAAGRDPGRMAVNVAAHQLQREGFTERVSQHLRETGLEPWRLELEITESALVQANGVGLEEIHALRDLGVGLAIDDFGTGYSSLLYIKRLPVHWLKIDKGFVREMESDAEARNIVLTIITLAQSLNLGVIAEGVETQAQRALLADAGVMIGQGFLWARPSDDPWNDNANWHL